MRTRTIWIGVVLVLCACGLAVSQALSLERWVDASRWAAPPALAQETRPPASPVLRSRFGRVVPAGWSAPRLVEEPARSGQALLTRLGLPSAHAADVALPPVAGLSLVEAPSVGPWPRPIPLAASVMQYRPALGWAVSPGDCADPKPIRRILAAMPGKCDDRLWGNWKCWATLQHSGRWIHDYPVIFSRTVGAGGYEHISRRVIWSGAYAGYDRTETWKVDEKWHPIPGGAGRLYLASCTGLSSSGHSVLSINEKNPDGSGRSLINYFLNATGVGWRRRYTVWWEDGKQYHKLRDHRKCDRES